MKLSILLGNPEEDFIVISAASSPFLKWEAHRSQHLPFKTPPVFIS